MKKYLSKIANRLLTIILPATALTFATTSCENVYDNEGDCDPHYYVRFVFDMNMEYADAFNEQVKSVDVWIFEKESHDLVQHISDSGDALKDDGYMLPINVEPGKSYNIIAWCGLENNRHFTVSGNINSLTDPKVTMARKVAESGATSDELLDELFQGIIDVENVPDWQTVQDVHADPSKMPVQSSVYGTQTVYAPVYEWNKEKQQYDVIYTVSLIRDTNNITLTLAHQNGDFNLDQLRIEMADNNGSMYHDNSLNESDQTITYTPWRIATGSLDQSRLSTKDFSFDDPIVDSHYANFLTSEISTARMTTGHEKTYRIYYKDTNQTIFQIPLTRWVTQMRSQRYSNMTDQEYLDRENQYDLLVFLQDDGRGGWEAVEVVINGWHIIENGKTPL